VIDVIQRLYLHQPHKMDRLDATYVASNKESIQTNSILRILNNQVQTDGFFVDYRGSDSGEFHSDTFYMEKTLRWQGLLIDGSRQSHRKLPAGNRQVDSLPICLSPKPFPVQVYGRIFKNSASKFTIIYSSIRLNNFVWRFH
jgi:hypothetical protein